MQKAVAYTRVSTDEQLENTSIAQQKEEIRDFCYHEGLNLVHIYDEGARSGSELQNRPELKQMFKHVMDKDNDIEFVVVWKADRISRDNPSSLYLFNKFREAGKHLICLKDNIDTRQPSAKLLFQHVSLVAEWERESIKTRTASGMEKNHRDGNHNGGIVFGYDSMKKQLSINTAEAEIVKYIFDKYANDNWGYRKIASELNKHGIKTKNNKNWTISTVKTILNNRIYIGEVKWKGKYTKGNHTPIIDKQLWNKTQKVLKLNSYTPHKIHPGSFPLSGLIKCPMCGSAMVQGNASQKYKYYQCSKNKNGGSNSCSSNLVKKEYAEEVVFDYLFTELSSINFLEPLINSIESNVSFDIFPLEEQLIKIEENLKSEHKKKKELITMKLKDYIDETIFSEMISETNQQIEEYSKMKARYEYEKNLISSHDFYQSTKDALNNLEAFFHQLEDRDKKYFVHKLIKEVHVKPANKSKDRTIVDIIPNFDFKYLEKIS